MIIDCLVLFDNVGSSKIIIYLYLLNISIKSYDVLRYTWCKVIRKVCQFLETEIYNCQFLWSLVDFIFWISLLLRLKNTLMANLWTESEDLD